MATLSYLIDTHSNGQVLIKNLQDAGFGNSNGPPLRIENVSSVRRPLGERIGNLYTTIEGQPESIKRQFIEILEETYPNSLITGSWDTFFKKYKENTPVVFASITCI